VGGADNTQDEFIELYNVSTVPVPLYDPLHATNVWRIRDAVDFDFPAGTVIGPGEHLLVVSFDPLNNPVALSAFRSTYGISAGVPIVGPYSGKLANDNEDIELKRPDEPNGGEVPYILVDRVKYFDRGAWPVEADGTGLSLQRVNPILFGNDPANWIAATPTAGPQSASGDSDGDGMPDAWETLHGLDPFNPLDAALDSDGDGLTNLQEYQIGTDPRDPRSGIRIDGITMSVSGDQIVLTFTAVANLSYTIESTGGLGAGIWQPVENVAAAATNRVIQLTVPANGPARFYRLRTSLTGGQGALRINSIQLRPGDQVALALSIPANRTCIVESAGTVTSSGWTTVADYPAGTSDRVVELVVPASGGNRFYRLRSP
jgi:hypothetical protein